MSCGKPTTAEAAAGWQPRAQSLGSKRLMRSSRDKKIAGVCGGVANYFGVDPTLVRFVWLATLILWGTGLLAYIVGWIVMPMDNEVPASA